LKHLRVLAGADEGYKNARIISFNADTGALNYNYKSNFWNDYDAYVNVETVRPDGSIVATEGLWEEPRQPFQLDANGVRHDPDVPTPLDRTYTTLSEDQSSWLSTTTSVTQPSGAIAMSAVNSDSDGILSWVANLVSGKPRTSAARAEQKLVTVGLHWCGTGYGETGPCSGQAEDVLFGFVQNATGSTANSELASFVSEHPGWVGIIDHADENIRCLAQFFIYRASIDFGVLSEQIPVFAKAATV
jgi:hypothetical protein